MNQSPLHRFALRRIEEAGRRLGAPTVTFSGKKISVPGEDIYVPNSITRFITRTSGFYLPLPPNAFGVVIFPDGTSHNMEGGVHAAPMGLYKLQYVDRHERLDFTSPISEMTTDGEKLTLKVVFRYRVVNPLIALQIDKPAEALIEHIEADVAQYIRTHDHTDIADSSENHLDSKLLSFFIQRHNRRIPLSKAFIITGIELKDFTGDNEYVQMRRKARMDERQNKIEKEQVGYQQELGILKAQYQAENEKNMAEHKAELEKKATEHKAEIEKMEARHKKEKQGILDQVHLREIELDDKRKHLQMRGEEFSQVIDAISRSFSSGIPMNPSVMKYITDLFDAYKEEIDGESQPASTAGQKSSASANHTPPFASPTASDKVEKLKNTLLSLLNPK
jgi:regulator of protease activity HflC (stomatin/prohibitin superfamily)